MKYCLIMVFNISLTGDSRFCLGIKNKVSDPQKNVEFEAKVTQDIITTKRDGLLMFMGSMGQSDEFQANYDQWMKDIIANDISIAVNRFHEFCYPWTTYRGAYDPDFIPQTIIKYFK